jgi:hypothetical protein
MSETKEYSKRITETFDPQLIVALYKNFSTQYIALQELIDNAVDDRIEGAKLVVDITFDKNKLKIENKNGKGMTPADLHDFFAWGVSKKDSLIGRYGQGGKAAIGYLAKGFVVETKPQGEQKLYSLNVDDWEDRSEGFKEFVIKESISPDAKDSGSVVIELLNLKKEFRDKTVINTIEKIYMPLILLDEVEFNVNGTTVVSKKVEFEKDFKADINIKIKFENQINKIYGWYGKVSTKSFKDGFRNGFRIYQYSRCVADGEYFDYSDARLKWSMEKLYGELFIDFDLPLNMNKTDIDRDSELWIDIHNEMKEEIKHIAERVRNSRDPAKKETRAIGKLEKIIQRESSQKLKLELTNYGPRLFFKEEEDDEGTVLKINREHKAYKEWAAHPKGELFFLTLIYALYEVNKMNKGREVKKFIDDFSDALIKKSIKYLGQNEK